MLKLCKKSVYEKPITLFLFLLSVIFIPHILMANIQVGFGKSEITPAIHTPSAGYANRMGKGMLGTHDPLYVVTLGIASGGKKIAFCGVDHLGFTYEMVQTITEQIQSLPELSACEIYIGSSHTHSGGGAYLDIPIIGESLAGTYSPTTAQFYIEKTVESIRTAFDHLQPAKIGFGYGHAEDISDYRGKWPENIPPLSDVAVIKVTSLDNTPLAVLFNFPLHPTALSADNMLFSADFVGCARESIESHFGSDFTAIYFNGAQAEIIPHSPLTGDGYADCKLIGDSLAKTVLQIWNTTSTDETLKYISKKETYSFKPMTTPFGLELPLENYQSELNLLIFNNQHVFITIPGELSCLYDYLFKKFGLSQGYQHVSILGLVNDAHGYILLPEAWNMKTSESKLSFGGEQYGTRIQNMVFNLFQQISL